MIEKEKGLIKQGESSVRFGGIAKLRNGDIYRR